MTIDTRRMFSGYFPLRDAMNQLVEASVITPESVRGHSAFPPVNVFMTDDYVVVELGLPGCTPENLNISLTGDTLIISGEVDRLCEIENSHTYIHEIWHGKFQRSFTLPIQVDTSTADASCADGILTLRLPKSESAKPHTIQVERKQSTITSDVHVTTKGVVHKDNGAKPKTKALVS